MNPFLLSSLSSSLASSIETLGWILIHFVWQGTVIALALAAILSLQTRRSPHLRYFTTLIALSSLAFAPFLTLATPPLSRPPLPSKTSETPQTPPLESPLPLDLPPAVESSFKLPLAPQTKTPLPVLKNSIAVTPISLPPSPLDSARTPSTLTDKVARCADFFRPWLPLCVSLWLAGVLLFTTRLVRLWNKIQHLRRTGTSSPPAELLTRFEELTRTLGIRRRVNLLMSTLIEVPTLIGWLRPVILLPASAIIGLTPSQLSAILAHELAHVRRHDYLVNLLQSVVETLLFYHPAVWWISRRLRLERELCCDDLAVKLLGDPLDYSRALLTLEEQRAPQSFHSITPLALRSHDGPLLHRIRQLLTPPPPRPPHSTMGTNLILLAVTLTLGFSTLLLKADPQTQQQLDPKIVSPTPPSKPTPPDSNDSTPTPFTNLTPETILARIGPTDITLVHLLSVTAEEMQASRKRIDKLRNDPSHEAQQQVRLADMDHPNRINIHLRDSVEIRLLSLAMEDYIRGLNPDQATPLRQEIDRIVKSRIVERARFFGLSKIEAVKLREQILATRYCSLKLHRPPVPSPEQLQNFYQSTRSEYREREKVRWQSILFRLDQPGGQEAAITKAKNAMTALNAGTPFEDVARQYSESLNAKNGGMWGWTTRGSLNDTKLQESLFNLPSGQTSGILSSEAGLQILKVLEHQPAQPKSLDSIRSFVEELYLLRQYLKAYDNLIADCIRKYPVWTIIGDYQSLPQLKPFPFAKLQFMICSDSRKTPPALPSAKPAPPPPPKNKETSFLDITPDTILARIGPTEISARNLTESCAPQFQQLSKHLESIVNPALLEKAREQVSQIHQTLIRRFLPDAVETRLFFLAMQDHLRTLDQNQQQEFLSSDEADRKQETERLTTSFKLSTPDEADAKLRETGYDPQLLRELRKERFYAQYYWKKHRPDPPSPERILAHYESRIENYSRPERIAVQFIRFYPHKVTTPPADVLRIAREARSAIQNGATFQDVAARYEEHIFNQLTESEQWITPGSLIDSDLERLLANLPKNQLTEPLPLLVRDFVIAKVSDTQPAVPIPLSECKDEIRKQLQREDDHVRIDKLIAELRQKYSVWTFVEGVPQRRQTEPSPRSVMSSFGIPDSVVPENREFAEADKRKTPLTFSAGFTQ